MKILLVLLVFAACGAFAQDKECKPADNTNAQKSVDRVVNWDQLYRAYQDYRHCDKGETEDLFTDALLRVVVEWKHVERLQQQMEKDKDYRTFVLRHLASPAALGDQESIYSRAKMSCPKGSDDFCKEIATTVKPMSAVKTQAAPGAAATPGAPATPAAPTTEGTPKK